MEVNLRHWSTKWREFLRTQHFGLLPGESTLKFPTGYFDCLLLKGTVALIWVFISVVIHVIRFSSVASFPLLLMAWPRFYIIHMHFLFDHSNHMIVVHVKWSFDFLECIVSSPYELSKITESSIFILPKRSELWDVIRNCVCDKSGVTIQCIQMLPRCIVVPAKSFNQL